MTRIDRYAFGSATALVVIGIMFGYLIGHRSSRQTADNPPTTIVSVDTVVVHDTSYVDHFREVTRMIVDTILVEAPVDSTSQKTDSLVVSLPREHVIVTNADSTVIAQISGFQPRMDWMRVIYPKKTVTIKELTERPQSRWSIGMTAGPAIVYNKDGIHGGIGVAVGVQYRF